MFTGRQLDALTVQPATVTNGTAYDLRIRATSQQPGSDGTDASHYRGSDWVVISNQAPQAAVSAPGAVTGLTATPGDLKLDLAWTAPSGPITHYDVQVTVSTTVADNAALGARVDLAWIAGTYPRGVTRPSHIHTVATNNRPYRVRVRAVNSAGNGPWAFVRGTPREPGTPAAPTGLTVSAGNGRLDLSWTAPAGTVTGYDVHYTSAPKTGAGGVTDFEAAQSGGALASGWWLAASRGTETSPPTATQAITGLTNNIEHRVRVRAKNAQGTGVWLHQTATPAAPVVAAGTATLSVSPTFLVAGQSATATVTLSAAQPGWVQVDVDRSGGTAHQARVLDPPVVFLSAGATSGTSTVRTNANVPQALGTKNIVIGTITEQPNVGTIVAGSPSSVEIEVVEPREVRNLDATAASGRLDLSWDAPLEVTATGYHVHYTSAAAGDVANDAAATGNNPAAAWVAVSRTGTTTSQAISSLTDGTTYRVRVRTVYVSDGSIRSAWSHASGTPQSQMQGPGAPTGLIVYEEDRSLGLEWTAPSGTVTGYDVHYTSAPKTGTGAVTDGAAVQTVSAAAGWVAEDRSTSGTDNFGTLEGLTNGTPYRVRVRAKNSNGNSGWVFGTGTPEPQAPPTNLVVTPGEPPACRVLDRAGQRRGRRIRNLWLRTGHYLGLRGRCRQRRGVVRAQPRGRLGGGLSTLILRYLVHDNDLRQAPG